jgi:hypothetical protein
MELRVKPSLANGAGSRGGAIALLIPKVGPPVARSIRLPADELFVMTLASQE